MSLILGDIEILNPASQTFLTPRQIRLVRFIFPNVKVTVTSLVTSLYNILLFLQFFFFFFAMSFKDTVV